MVLTIGQRSSLPRVAVQALMGLVIFFGLCWLSSQFTNYPERAEFYMTYLWRIVAITFFAILSFSEPNQVRWLLWACMAGQGFNAFQINLEYFQLGYCRYSYMSDWGQKGLDNNGYSILTIPVIAIAIATGFASRGWIPRGFAFLIAALQLHQLMLMESRGGLLGAVLTSIVAVIFMPKTHVNIALVAIGLLAASAMAGPPVIKEFLSSFESQETRDSSAESRFLLWKAGARIVADYPLLGVGPSASRYFVPIYYSGKLEGDSKALHNVFFEVGSEIGIPGLVAYLSFFLIPYYYVFRNRRALSVGIVGTQCTIAVLAGTPGYFLSSMFSSGSLIESSYVIPVLACSLFRFLQDGTLQEIDEIDTLESDPSTEEFDSIK